MDFLLIECKNIFFVYLGFSSKEATSPTLGVKKYDTFSIHRDETLVQISPEPKDLTLCRSAHVLIAKNGKRKEQKLKFVFVVDL